MPAVFHAISSFALPGKKWFVVSGEIVSGIVKKGMFMRVCLNSSMSFDLPIVAVEMITKMEGKSEVGLCTSYADENELQVLQLLNISGEKIKIEGADDPDNIGLPHS